jgi:hypothetical protein
MSGEESHISFDTCQSKNETADSDPPCEASVEDNAPDSFSTWKMKKDGVATDAVAGPHHNAPEDFTDDQRKQLDSGREALSSLKRTFEDYWIPIARALRILNDKANAEIGRKRRADTFKRLKEEQGFGAIDGATVSRLIKIVEHEAEVRAWRDTLTPQERINWASPGSVYSRTLKKAKKSSTTLKEKLLLMTAQLDESEKQLDESKQEIKWLEAHVEDLEAARENEPVDQTDAADLHMWSAEELAANIRANMEPDEIQKLIAILSDPANGGQEKKSPAEGEASSSDPKVEDSSITE